MPFAKSTTREKSYYSKTGDVNIQAGTRAASSEKINNMYVKVLRYASIIKNSSDFDFILETTRGKLQQGLEEIYEHIKGKIEKKRGLIKNSLLGSTRTKKRNLILVGQL